MRLLLYLLVALLIVGLFLYSKLLPYKDRLNPKYQKIFSVFDRLFTPWLNLLRKLFSPLQVGTGLAIDMAQIVLLLLLLFILKLL